MQEFVVDNQSSENVTSIKNLAVQNNRKNN